MEPLALLFDETTGEPLPLPPELLALHGPLRISSRPDRPHVFANFVVTVDGVVAIDPPRGKGSEISGGNPHDRAVMGLLRAVADAVVIGAGNLRAEGDHVWTGERICPELAGPYARLRAARTLAAVLEAAELGPGALVLLESGPTSTTRYLAEGAVDELFLTQAPIFVGRTAGLTTLALIEGRYFRPGTLSARLLSARRSDDFLFLRYALT